MAWCLQRELIEHQIQPAAKLEPYLRHFPYQLKAQCLVQGNASHIGSVNRSHNDVHIFAPPCFSDQQPHQRTPQPCPTAQMVNVD